jgi:hypothetical protein
MKGTFFCTMLLLVASIGPSLSGFAQQPVPTRVLGGQGGIQFSDMEFPPGGRVLEVHVFCGEFVDAVQLLYILPDGQTLLGPRHGGSGGQERVFRLDSDEYIVGLSGRYGAYIDSLQLRTNKRTSPIFGGAGGSRSYRIDVTQGHQAVGLVGRAGEYLDAVGLTSIPIMIRQIEQTKIVGGEGGNPFADRDVPQGARISEVRVRSGNNIDSIQAVYTLPDGSLLEGPLHGGRGGSNGVFRLDPDEYITGFSGRSGLYIDSLIIQTNKRRSQVFGGSGGSRVFSIAVPAGNRAIGFAGRSGDYLDSIGLTYAPIGSERENQRRRPSRYRRDR